MILYLLFSNTSISLINSSDTKKKRLSQGFSSTPSNLVPKKNSIEIDFI